MTRVSLVPRDESLVRPYCYGCGATPELLNEVTLPKADVAVYLCFSCIDLVFRRALFSTDVE